MRTSIVAIMASCAIAFCGIALAADAPAETPLAWAFPVKPEHVPPSPKQNPKTVEHLPGSKAAYTAAQLDNPYFAPDWFPDQHPAMPKAVAQGDKAIKAWPCAECHTEIGAGGPEAAVLTGLSAAYIVEQVMEFRAGRRRAAQSRMEAPQGMAMEAQHVTDAALQEAAAYFAKLTYHSHLRVVETDTAPETVVHDGLVYAKAPGGGSEPLGERIVEVPDDIRQWDFGDPHMAVTAYVPKGSIARGEKLVASGDGAAPCATCHGVGLKGIGNVPPLAGRSPSYLARQLYDIQYGTRKGPTVALMQPEVAHMTAADRIAIVAYIGSLKP